MTQNLVYITYLVRDYDEAIQYFTTVLDFELREDTKLDLEKRWVLVSPRNGSPYLLLAKAATPLQVSLVGSQAGERVFLFLHTDNFQRDHDSMMSKGVEFLEAPRHEAYGTVAIFSDLYGNRWDLLALKNGLEFNQPAS